MRKKKEIEKTARDVVDRLMIRTFGWPDGTTLAGMSTDDVYDAMEWIKKQLWPEKPEQ